MLFSGQGRLPELSSRIGTFTITTVSCVKFLGLWLDSRLQWRKHITTLLIKLKQNTNMLKQSNKFLDKYTKKQIYHAHILSHLKYGLLFWGSAIDDATHKKIQKVLDYCFTLCTGLQPSVVNLKAEKILTLSEMIHLEYVKLGYKLQHDLLPKNVHNIL